MGMPSSMPSRSIRPLSRSDPKIRMRSSCKRQVEPRRARITLAAGAAAQLVVDAPRLVPFGAEDVKAAECDDALALRVVEERLDVGDVR